MSADAAATIQADYFTGEFLTPADYAAEQAFQIAIQRAGASTLNDHGLVWGLRVDETAVRVQVGAGLAIDQRGRLVLLTEPLDAPPRPADAQVLAIAYGETRVPAPAGGVDLVVETPVLIWCAQADAAAAATALVLGTGAPLTTAGRRYAGMAAGTLTFAQASDAAAAGMTGWSAPPLLGLRIDADPLVVAARTATADAPGQGTLAVSGGTMGVGTLSPQAHLDILAPVVALVGPGLLTSFSEVARGTSTMLGATLHVGDTVMTTDRDGRSSEAQVVRVTADNEIITDAPLNCVDAPFTFEQRLAVSVRAPDEAKALAIGRDGLVGIGIDPPAARLHLGPGDLELPVDGTQLRFGGDGGIATGDGASAVRFATAAERTSFAQRGAIRWLPGRDTTPLPVGMILDEHGCVGIGTAEPSQKLEVAGAIKLLDGALLFPDGTSQQTAMCAVPIGAVIDWWQGVSTNAPPDNFAICSGGTVHDDRSPFNGQLLPNLSGQFVYGLAPPDQPPATHPPTTVDAGPIGPARGSDLHDHSFLTPTHVHDFPHTHPDVSGQTGHANNDDGYLGLSGYNASNGHTHGWTGSVGGASALQTGDNSDVGDRITTGMASTLPPYIALIKLIRIW